MAERNRCGIILLPAFLYGGVISIATDGAIYFFYEPSIYELPTLVYFWSSMTMMCIWNLLWYPKLLWWWASDEFYYPHSGWKMTYKTAFFFSFCLQMINVATTGFCLQKILHDPYFQQRLLYTPTVSFCTLFFFECMGMNRMIRNLLMRDL